MNKVQTLEQFKAGNYCREGKVQSVTKVIIIGCAGGVISAQRKDKSIYQFTGMVQLLKV